MQKLLFVYFIIQKIEPQAKSAKYFQICFSPIWEGKWRRSEHAHGLFFRPPGVQPLYGAGRKESSGTGLRVAKCSRRQFCSEFFTQISEHFLGYFGPH